MQVRKYLEFVEGFQTDRAPIPCSEEKVALYATWLARTMKYGSIQNYLSGLSDFLKQNGEGAINYGSYVISTTLKGIRRAKGDEPRRAKPILPGMLRRIFAELSNSPGHNAWRAAVLLSFRALLRKAQVTESDAVLRRGDFKFFDWGLVVTIRRTKTIQFRERVLEVPVARCCDPEMCAVRWVEWHFRELPAGRGDAAFRLPAPGGGSSGLTYPIYQRTLKMFADRAGLDPADLSSHSLRRGGCTFLAMCGATVEELKARGDWASETVYVYLKTPLAVRILDDMRVAAALCATAD